MSIELTSEQQQALVEIKAFLLDERQDAFILRGSAGTGKTTLIAKLTEMLEAMHLSCALLAPTGRAARILGSKIRQITGNDEPQASTIHRQIYTLTEIQVNEAAETANDPGVRMIFPLKEEESMVSLFVIDESSMVGDKETHGDVMQFGSGRLLLDLVTYARAGRPGRQGDRLTKLLFVGDPVQLPPVGEHASPALSDAYMAEQFKLQVSSFDLKGVMRQAQGSAILERATALRDAMTAKRFFAFSLRPNGDDILQVDASGAVDRITEGLRRQESTVAVVHANATALQYNRSIRERRWGDADRPIQVGETLLVNKNSTTHSLSNGDLVKVIEVAAAPESVGVGLKGGHHVVLSFRQVTVAFRASDGTIVQTECVVLENLLDSPHRELSPLEQRALLVDFRRRHPDLRPKDPEFRKVIRRDPYFNALQVKYGYALTCHKAQGGEWTTVIVDFAVGAGARNASFFRWAYTAITRAVETLVVVNAPSFGPRDGKGAPDLNTTSADANQPVGEDFTTDPDWHRLSFSAATAPLMPSHQHLRAAWTAQGIAIEHLQHLQYCERYTLARGGKRAVVQYYHDKKHRVSRAGAVPGATHDAALADDALISLHALIKNGGETPSQFVQDFLEDLDARLADSAIRRTGFKSWPFRLRVSVADGLRRGDIDFSYDGSFSWTSAQEVGGPGSSKGLWDEVLRLMTATEPASEPQ